MEAWPCEASSERLRVPKACWTMTMPIRKPKSPSRLTRKAFLEASAAAGRWYQKPISR